MNNSFIKNCSKHCFLCFIIFISSFILTLTGCKEKKTIVSKTDDQIKETETVEKTKIPEKKDIITTPQVVIKSTLAGSWYPADPAELKSQIDGFFQNAHPKLVQDVIALILPHAGYVYSGKVAACGLKAADKDYKRIIVIGPSHRFPLIDVVAVPMASHFETPLGKIPLDTGFIDELLKYPVFQNIPTVHENEHSVQIQLPLLQHKWKEFKLVPLVAGDCSFETIQKAASILASLAGPETLVIASSDFVHYGFNYGYVPFKENIPEQIKKLDMGAYQYIASLDPKGFLEYREKTGATICGFIPIALLLSMLDSTVKTELIDYNTSGQLTGSFENSVSYLAAAFSGRWNNTSTSQPKITNSVLTDNDQKTLLDLARKTIIYYLQNHQVPQPADLGINLSDAMKMPRAAFVTLNKNSQLRGCIGDILPRQPLYSSVITNAVNAAVNDHRFTPLTISECNDITIEISALTVPQPIQSKDDIRIGIDGVILSKDGCSAVFLPHVAPQQGWDVNTMLTHLSLKAGLSQNSWKEGASFITFQADVFGEHEK